MNQGEVLVFSFIGYTSQEVKVTNQTELNVVLAESSSTLQEVAVIGSRAGTADDRGRQRLCTSHQVTRIQVTKIASSRRLAVTR